MSKIFAKKLKEYRKELEQKRGEKVVQVQLAEELGISKGAIGNFESGLRVPSKSILKKLAKHSGKSIDYWMEGIEEYEPPNTVDLVLNKMITNKVITSTNLNDEIKAIIWEAVLLEIERKLK
jgi:transcriptional regulator with XRE-family HTH domain